MNKKQLLILLNCIIPYLDAANTKEYGLLTVSVQSIDVCKGPKRRNCCDAATSVSKGVYITYDLNVKEAVVLTNGKVAAKAQGKEVFKFNMKAPCDHFLIKSLFKIYLNLTENCTVPKGHYIFTVNIQDVSEKYYGGKFFYGNMTFKSIFAGNDCNLFCTIMNVIMVPKKSK